MSKFRERLKAAIAAAGLNPRQVAQLCGVDYPYLSKVINGKQGPSDKLLMQVASVPQLKLSYESLKADWLSEKDPEEASLFEQVKAPNEDSVLEWMLSRPDEEIQAFLDKVARWRRDHK